jgi:hypothetical protein
VHDVGAARSSSGAGAELTATCPIKQAQNWSDRCAARCPDLPKVL